MSKVFGLSVDKQIRSTSDLREVMKMPSHYVDSKVIDHTDPLSERFIYIDLQLSRQIDL